MATYLINGQSPASLGVELCRRVRRNQAIDTVTLQVTTEEGITGVLPFAYDDEVVITRDGVTWFRGWVMSPIVAGQSGMEGMSIEIGGPWWQLMRLTYTQLTLPVGGETTPRYTYGATTSGERQTTLEIISQVLDYAIAKGAVMQVGTLVLDDAKPPKAVKLDRRCDELVTSALEWHPDVIAWFDYETDPPTFHLTKRGDTGTVQVLTWGDIEQCSPMPRPDLVTSGVVIRYERGGLQVSAGGMRPAQLVDDYPDGADATAMDAIVQTITVGRNDVAVPGLAERLFESYSGLIWEGGMALVQEDCNTGLRPGMSVNVTGGQVAWETMQAFIQSVSEDLMSGQTTVEFGLPQFCGARPRLFHLTRRRHNDQDKDADAAGEERLEAAAVDQAPSTALTLYATEVTGGVAKLRVTPGFVSTSLFGGEEDQIPPTLDDTELDAVPAPYITLGVGGSVDVWLKLELTPTMTEHTFTDAMGTEVVEWRPTGPFIFGAQTEIVSVEPTRQVWDLNFMTGEVNEPMKLGLRIGSANWPGGAEAPTVSPENTSNIVLVLFPPGGFVQVMA